MPVRDVAAVFDAPNSSLRDSLKVMKNGSEAKLGTFENTFSKELETQTAI
jgi:hypothetical protein